MHSCMATVHVSSAHVVLARCMMQRLRTDAQDLLSKQLVQMLESPAARRWVMA